MRHPEGEEEERGRQIVQLLQKGLEVLPLMEEEETEKKILTREELELAAMKALGETGKTRRERTKEEDPDDADRSTGQKFRRVGCCVCTYTLHGPGDASGQMPLCIQQRVTCMFTEKCRRLWECLNGRRTRAQQPDLSFLCSSTCIHLVVHA